MPFIAGLIIGAVIMCAIMMRCFADVHARIDVLESRVGDDFDSLEDQVETAGGKIVDKAKAGVAEVMPHPAAIG